MHWKLDAVGVRKKAQQWMESGETSAKKIGKTEREREREREKQYREILKQIQENPAKTKYKGKSKQK
jgi:hypothetical protein